MSIEHDIAALEKALEAGPEDGPWEWRQVRGMGARRFLYAAEQQYAPLLEMMASFPTCDHIAACSPDRIRRLLDALKEHEEAEWTWVRADELMPKPGRLIIKAWPSKESVWCGIYNGTDKEGSFDLWMYVPPWRAFLKDAKA